MSTETFLTRVPIFSNCSAEEISAIASLAQEAVFEPAQIIVTQGSPGQAFYMITSGRVEILRDGGLLGVFGPGDFFGTKQHGLPRFKLADITQELELLHQAKGDALAMLQRDPNLRQAEHTALRRAIEKQFGESLVLAQVG